MVGAGRGLFQGGCVASPGLPPRVERRRSRRDPLLFPPTPCLGATAPGPAARSPPPAAAAAAWPRWGSGQRTAPALLRGQGWCAAARPGQGPGMGARATLGGDGSGRGGASGVRDVAQSLAATWRLWHVSCFGDDQDGPTISDEGDGFKHVAQLQSSTGAEVEVEEEKVGSANEEQEQSFKDRDWFMQVQKIKENLHGRIVRFQTERWTVPWTAQTIAQVMILWIATFWLVGSWIVPFLAHAAGFSRETLTHRGQALYSLLTDITEGLAGIVVLHQCLGRFRPLPPGWFEFSLKGRWHLDVMFGCLLFPLVNLLSHINISLVPMSPGPVAGVSSVEQSIVARDPVAMALYAVVVTVCAPIWEEIVFRGFLLPSLTRYMPLPWSIIASAAAFALAHFNAQRVMPLVFLGVVMGGVFARSRNLLASMVLHSLWNGFVFLDLMK